MRYDAHTTQWQVGDRLWTLAMGGLRAVILSVTGDMVTLQLFDKPFHIRRVHQSKTWMFHKVMNDAEMWNECSMG